jgi:hypothetical protein
MSAKGVKTMTNINHSPEILKKIKSQKEYIYSSLYKFEFDLTDEKANLFYKDKLKKYFKDKDIEFDLKTLSLPDSEFCEEIKKDNLEFQKEMEELFKDADLLTYKVGAGLFEPERVNNSFAQISALRRENKILASSVAPLSLDNGYDLALFSNGLLFVSELITDTQIKMLKRMAKEYYVEIDKIKEIDRDKIHRINAYARYIYQDKNYIKSIKNKTEFIDELFANDSVCLTACDSIVINPEVRNCVACFDNGRYLISKETYLLSDISPIIEKVRIFFDRTRVFLEREFVPQSYIDAIYEKAKTKEWFIDKKTQLEKVELQKSKNDKNKRQLSSDDINKMNKFIDKLFENSECLTNDNNDLVDYIHKDKYALFDNGVLILNENSKFAGEVLNFEVLIKRKLPNMKIKKEYVSKEYLDAIYDKIYVPKEAKSKVAIEMLKQKAKRISRSENIPHHEALEIVAKLNRFNNWKEVTQISEYDAAYYISCLKRKYLKMRLFQIHASNISKEKGIDIDEAKEIFAKKVDLASWARLEALSIEASEEIAKNYKK